MNIQYKSKKGLEVFLAFVAINGLVLLIIGLFLLIRTISFNNNSEVIEATVDDCDKEYKQDNNGNIKITYILFVNYNYNGTKYERIVLTGLNEEKVSGDTISIRIKKDNPSDARYMNQTTFGVVILIFLGIILSIGSGYLFAITLIQSKEYIEIKQNGRRIDAKITTVRPYRNVYNPNYQYYILECECMEKTFTSYPYKNGIGISEGDTVPVYYTSLQKGKYFVDVENTIINKKDIGDNWRLK